MVAYLDIKLQSLLLDPANPRLPAREGQTAIFADLLKDKSGQQLLRLAKEIVQQGGLSPIDIPYVVYFEKSLYTVVEGNRRVAALKFLANPDLVKATPLHAGFLELAASFKPPSKIMCAVAENLAETRRWIELRHTGPNDGAGVVPWNPAEKARFLASSGRPGNKALDIVDEFLAIYPAKDMTDLVTTVRDTQLTLLARLVNDPAVRDRLGIMFPDEGGVIAHYDAVTLQPAVKRILSDIKTGAATSRSLNSKEDRAKYLDALGPVLPSASARTPDAARLQPVKLSSGAQGKKARKTTPPVRFLFRELSLAAIPGKAGDVLEELKKLDIEKYPNTVAALLRVVVELVVYGYAEAKTWKRPDKLKDAIRKCANAIDPTGHAPKLVGVRTGLSDGTSGLAAATLQGYMHNPDFHASPSELRAIAKNYAYLLQALNDDLGNSSQP